MTEVEGNAGWYKVDMQVRPHFKYMGAFFTLSLVGKLDKEWNGFVQSRRQNTLRPRYFVTIPLLYDLPRRAQNGRMSLQPEKGELPHAPHADARHPADRPPAPRRLRGESDRGDVDDRGQGAGGAGSGAGGASGSTGTNGGGGGGITYLPGYTITFDALTVAPGEEKTQCVVKRLGNAAAMHVGEIHNVLGLGSHHMIVYRVNDTAEQPTPFDCKPFTDTLDPDQGLAAHDHAEEGRRSSRCPTGVAFTLDANQMVRLEMHYINATQAPLHVTAHVDDHPDRRGDLQGRGRLPLHRQPGHQDLRRTSTATLGPTFFPLPADATRRRTSSRFTGHEHQCGTNVTVADRGDQQDDGPGTSVYDVPELALERAGDGATTIRRSPSPPAAASTSPASGTTPRARHGQLRRVGQRRDVLLLGVLLPEQGRVRLLPHRQSPAGSTSAARATRSAPNPPLRPLAGSFARRYGPWALVTGASSGIGAEFTRQLAARGLHLVLVARRKDRLDALAAELTATHGVEARSVELDLARPDFLPELERATAGLEVGLLVNNAGFGWKGRFLDSDLETQLAMLDVNCRASLVLAHTYGRPMAARARGGIVFTSSTAAFQGLPFSSHYAATKGYGLQLAEGLWYELEGNGVDVLALCPGPTDTEGPRRTGVDPSKIPVKMMEVGPVVEGALASLGRAPVVIPGLVNRLTYLAVRLTPRRLATSLAGRNRAEGHGGIACPPGNPTPGPSPQRGGEGIQSLRPTMTFPPDPLPSPLRGGAGGGVSGPTRERLLLPLAEREDHVPQQPEAPRPLEGMSARRPRRHAHADLLEEPPHHRIRRERVPGDVLLAESARSRHCGRAADSPRACSGCPSARRRAGCSRRPRAPAQPEEARAAAPARSR